MQVVPRVQGRVSRAHYTARSFHLLSPVTVPIMMRAQGPRLRAARMGRAQSRWVRRAAAQNCSYGQKGP
jgi:hypothetical protein